jgi:hypothetical protein
MHTTTLRKMSGRAKSAANRIPVTLAGGAIDTYVRRKGAGWIAVWHGRPAKANFRGKGAALAWIGLCNAYGEWRA